MNSYSLWTGSYTDGKPDVGVRLLKFDGERLWVEESFGPLTDPSYVQPMGGRVFAVEELPEKGSIIELIPGASGLRRHPVPGSGFCHITACGQNLYASGYAGGCLTGVDMDSGEVCCYLEHFGKGSDPERQEKPHIHSALPAPEGKRLLVADLGLDKLFQYEVGEKGKLSPYKLQPFVKTGDGQGPRHFAFHPSGKWLYLVAELDLSLLVYRYDRSLSRLEYLEEHSMRKEGPNSLAADVHVSPDGRFVYASVRGIDRIFYFSIGKNGELKCEGDFSSGGREPRSFDLSPDGRFLAAANQHSGNVALFSLDGRTGAPEGLPLNFPVPGVSCVKWDQIPVKER